MDQNQELIKQQLQQERINNYSAPPGLIFQFNNEQADNTVTSNLEYQQIYNQLKNPRLPKPTYNIMKTKFDQMQAQMKPAKNIIQQVTQDMANLQLDINTKQNLMIMQDTTEIQKLQTNPQQQYNNINNFQQFPISDSRTQYLIIPTQSMPQQQLLSQQQNSISNNSNPSQQNLSNIQNQNIRLQPKQKKKLNLQKQNNYNQIGPQIMQMQQTNQFIPPLQNQSIILPNTLNNQLQYQQQEFQQSNENTQQHYSNIIYDQYNPQLQQSLGVGQINQHYSYNSQLQYEQLEQLNQASIYNFQAKVSSGQQSQFQQNVKLNVYEYIQDIVALCKDQNGSRTIQQQFQQCDDKEKELIFKSIQPIALDLMKDVFGNYVIQKILESGNDTQKQELICIMKGSIINLSMHTYGCRVIQRALEVFTKNQNVLDQIIGEISQDIIKCVEDQNGNHVIQKCFEIIDPSKLKNIIDQVVSKISELSFHSFGCRVIQKILEHCYPDKIPEISQIYSQILDNLINLCECQYGNYIIQSIIEKGPILEKKKILEVIKNNFVRLSQNKFASNVTEKSVIFSDMEFKRNLTNQLLELNSNNIQDIGIVKLTKDQFGNFVIQKLIEYSDIESKLKIYQKLKQDPRVEQDLIKNNYGKFVLQHLEKIFSNRKL